MEVANVVGAVHKVGSLAEEGVDAGGDDYSLDLPLLAGRAREDLVTRILGDGQGLTSERRLVYLERVPIQQSSVCRHDIAELDADDVPRDEDRRLLLQPSPVPLHLPESKTNLGDA